MTTGKCSELCKSALKGVGLEFSDGYNAKWNIDDLVYQFVLMPELEALQRGNMLRVLPPRAWHNCRVGYGSEKIKRMRYDDMLSQCMEMISYTVKYTKERN